MPAVDLLWPFRFPEWAIRSGVSRLLSVLLIVSAWSWLSPRPHERVAASGVVKLPSFRARSKG